MCNSVVIDGEEFETIGAVAEKLGVPMRLLPERDWEPEAEECLCNADVPRMAKEAGRECRDVSREERYLPWVSYVIGKGWE